MSRMILCLVLALSATLTVSAVAGEKGDRDKAMALLTGADSLFTATEYAKAAEMCKRALAEDASCAAAHFKLGQCQEQLRQNKEAFRSYQTAVDLAKKDNDLALSRKAQTAAEKIGGGAMQITVADQKLIDKLLPLAEEAFADDQLETARSAYESIIALKPTHEKAAAGLVKTQNAIEARGDPIKARIAAAMLAEVFYNFGIGKKAEATKMAQEIVSKHAETAAGKEAEQLLANNFEPPKDISAQLAEAKKQMKEQAEKAKKVATKPVTPSTTTTTTTATVSRPPASGVDVDALEKVATDDAKKLSKDALIPAMKDTFAKGKDFYSKATPGSEGNQKAVAGALEQFIRCEAIYLRIDEEKMVNDDVAQIEKQASMLRYACMKMTILSH